MEKKDITDFKEFYATFMRIKESKAEQDYTWILLRNGKDEVKKNGADAGRQG